LKIFVTLNIFSLSSISVRTLTRLQPTTQRLGAAAVSSESYAAHKYSNLPPPVHAGFRRRCAKPQVEQNLR
jgi:hypothetical protein